MDGAFDEDPPVEPVLKANSVLRPGAKPAAIAATEDRVGAQLPDDYETFLACSDGAFADVGDAVRAADAPHRKFSEV